MSDLVHRFEEEIFYRIPDRCVLKMGFLEAIPPARHLDEDIIAFQFNDNSWLDVGWYPSHDPDGYYIVAHLPSTAEGWDGRTEIIRTNSTAEVANAISSFNLDKFYEQNRNQA